MAWGGRWFCRDVVSLEPPLARPTLYNAFWILDAKVARPPHATWYVRRVSLPPALQALTCRLGAPAHLCDERVFSYPGTLNLIPPQRLAGLSDGLSTAI